VCCNLDVARSISALVHCLCTSLTKIGTLYTLPVSQIQRWPSRKCGLSDDVDRCKECADINITITVPVALMLLLLLLLLLLNPLATLGKHLTQLLPSDRLRVGWPGFDSSQVKDFSLLHSIQTISEDHPTSYPLGAGGSFPRDKTAVR
jgi:hypothetical protein